MCWPPIWRWTSSFPNISRFSYDSEICFNLTFYMFRYKNAVRVCLLASLACTVGISYGQNVGSAAAQQGDVPLTPRERMLLEKIDQLEQRVNALEARPTAMPGGAGSPANGVTEAAAAPVKSAEQTPASTVAAISTGGTATAANSNPLALSDGTTINFGLDGYYGYNFEHPVGGVNLLRGNDVLSNSFSLSQAVVMIDREPDVSAGRRLGYRLDLMFGQQTEILQGNPANETRPQVYRNIFQAYGSYVLPLGSGLQVDFGKFASSLGVEGTYTKDQLNYSRSYFYNFLPYYHEGLRATYTINPKLTLQYWLVNGAQQTEDFNGFKSQAAIITVKPSKNVTWNLNYYEGQEQRAVVPLYNPVVSAIPTQPGLSINPVTGRHDGRLNIIDTYASFNLSSKWSATLEGDYVINRVAGNSAPTYGYGGAGYLHRQLTSKLALNGRFEYLGDPGGLYSGTRQDLKDVTGTAVYQPANGFQARFEYRRDFSNRPFFLTNNPAILSNSQNTLTLGLLWWFGGKEGAW